jgi:DnaJ-domain-containing protein 1
MREYHPDRVAGLAPEFMVIAEQRAKEFNAAYAEARSRRRTNH